MLSLKRNFWLTFFFFEGILENEVDILDIVEQVECYFIYSFDRFKRDRNNIGTVFWGQYIDDGYIRRVDGQILVFIVCVIYIFVYR